MIRLNELPAEMFTSQILCLSPLGTSQPLFEPGLEDEIPLFDLIEGFTVDGGEEDDLLHANNVDEATLFIESLNGSTKANDAPLEDLFSCSGFEIADVFPKEAPSTEHDIPKPVLYSPTPVSLEEDHSHSTFAPLKEAQFNFNLRISGVSLPKIAGLDESDTVQENAKKELSADFSVGEPCKKRQKRSQPVQYVHDADTCWVCNSSKSEARKAALHRYILKRSRRMQASQRFKYTARSAVASSRNRQKGRFVEAVQWVSLS